MLRSSRSLVADRGARYLIGYGRRSRMDTCLGETYRSGRQITLGYGNVSYPQYVGGTYGSTSTTYLAWLNFGNYGETARSYGPNSNLIWNRTYNNRGQDTALALNDWATSNNGLNYTQFIQQYNYTGSVGNNGNLVSSAESFSPGAAVPYANLPARPSLYSGERKAATIENARQLYLETFGFMAFYVCDGRLDAKFKFHVASVWGSGTAFLRVGIG